MSRTKQTYVIVGLTLILAISGYTIFRFYSRSVEISRAESYARELAVKIQSQCNMNGACPEHLAGWEITGETYEWKYFGKYRIKIGYMGNKKNFQLFVRHGFAKGLLIDGGTQGSVSEKNWSG